MSTVTVAPGALVRLDPSDEKVVLFDFDELNLAQGVTLANSAPTYGITITVIKQNGTTPLTFDSAGLTGSSRKVQARLLATTATLGDRYTVACKGTTSESPSQKKEYSFTVLIQDN